MSLSFVSFVNRRRYLLSRLVHLASAVIEAPIVLRRWIAAAIDAVLCIVATWIAFSLREGAWDLFALPVLKVAGVALCSWFALSLRMGVYRSFIRYAGLRTLIGLGMVLAFSAVPLIATFMIYGIEGVPRTIALIQPLIFLALLAIVRMVIGYVLVEVVDGHRIIRPARFVAIYGAGRAGQQLALALRHEPNVHIVAYVDDDAKLARQKLNGVEVFHSSSMSQLINREPIDEVLLALPSVPRSRRKTIIEDLQQFKVHVRSLPSVGNIIDGRVSITDLHEVPVEDLLGRDAVNPDNLLIDNAIDGKTVLVTGAGGSIGGELTRQIIRSRPRRLVLLEQSEFALYTIESELRQLAASHGLSVDLIPELANVAERNSVERIFKNWCPDTVFHAAAYKHVPLVEVNPVSGLRNNVFGTLNCCLAAEMSGVSKFILVSTDKAVRPTNVMGASKRLCELILQARAGLLRHGGTGPIFSMVRFGNVLGSSGSVVPLFKRQISMGGPVTLTHRDVTRYFMTIPEAAQLVIQAGACANGGEVFVLDMGQPIRIIDLATSLARLSGLTVRDELNPEGDIEIREIGLRKGEKLYEELLIGDNPQPTGLKRIMKANEAMIPWIKLEPQLAELDRLLREGRALAAVDKLQELVPEFRPDLAGTSIEKYQRV